MVVNLFVVLTEIYVIKQINQFHVFLLFGIYFNIFLPPKPVSYSWYLLNNKSNLLYNIVRAPAMTKWLAVSNYLTLSTS